MLAMQMRKGSTLVVRLKASAGNKPLICQNKLLKSIASPLAFLPSLFSPGGRISCYSFITMKNSAKKAIRESVAAPPPAREAGPRSHKFHVGQAVYFTAGTMGRPGASGSYKIVKLLPSEGDEHQYRIKS